MTLAYNHVPPGTPKKERAERLRRWEGDSPYFANRARRGPRGHAQLPLIERDITFRNIPEIREITVATYQPKGIKDPDVLVVARTALLALTGTMPEMTETETNVAQWHIQKGKRAGCKTTMYGNDAYEFLDRCIHLVFPKIKDWQGIKGMWLAGGSLLSRGITANCLAGSTGDGSGNISWGFTPDQVQLFPEIEFNYSLYPSKVCAISASSL
jgi:large subunit ribosomal protein L5